MRCAFWVTPSTGDRVLISRKELMNFHIIPKSFLSIMKTSSGGTQMCQSCAGILRLSHFEKFGEKHFVSLISKKAPGRQTSSKELYRSKLKNICNPCQKVACTPLQEAATCK